MKYGCNLYSKNKLSYEEVKKYISSAFNIDNNDILVVEDIEDWLKRYKEIVVLEYNGVLPEEDDEYPKYHFYQLWYENEMEKSKTDKLQDLLGEDFVVDIN